MVNISEILPSRIKQAREEAGLTMDELASKIGVSHNVTIARYESGTRAASVAVLEQIAGATGKPLTWFVEELHHTPNREELSPTELKILNLYNQLNGTGVELLLDYLDYLLMKYKKSKQCTKAS